LPVWLNQHQPLSVLYTFEGDVFDEDKYVLICMKQFGIDNVRGGSYSEIDVSRYRDELRRQLIHADDRCFRCGKSGHFAYQCRH